MSEVFISHHVDEDAQLASVLKEWIEAAFLGEVGVFVSSQDIRSGERWLRRLEKELADAKIMMVLCSENSVSMPWINFELGAGYIRDIRIIPICHSGLDVDSLPEPIRLFQGFKAESDEFPEKLMGDLAKALGYERMPRLPYQEVSAQIRQVLLATGDQVEDVPTEEGAGFLDHMAAFTDDTAELTTLITSIGADMEEISVETSTFTEQLNRAMANKSQGTPRHMQRLTRAYSKKLNAYTDKLQNLNRDYAEVLPRIEVSGQFIISFHSPQTPEDFEAVKEFLSVLDGTQNATSKMANQVIVLRNTLDGIPNVQRHLSSAKRRTVEQYDVLTGNLDNTLALFDKLETVASRHLQ